MKPDDGYITYILNPHSGASSHRLISRRFKEYLYSKGFKIRLTKTNSLEHACKLAIDSAIDCECAMVVVAGGDGTVREVVSGLEGSEKPLLVVACGTENLLANELGFDEKLETLVKAFEEWKIRPLDLGHANGKSFTSVTGFGFDADVVKLVSARRKGHISHTDYFWPIWRSFWNHKFPEMKVRIDGEDVFEGKGLVFVGNISKYALGLGILRHADFSDGLLDICIYKCESKLRLVKHSIMTIFKIHMNFSDVIYRRGRHIIVSSNEEGVGTEIDGDPGPQLPVEIKVVPQAVKCIVPEGAKPAGMRTRLIRIIG